MRSLGAMSVELYIFYRMGWSLVRLLQLTQIGSSWITTNYQVLERFLHLFMPMLLGGLGGWCPWKNPGPTAPTITGQYLTCSSTDFCGIFFSTWLVSITCLDDHFKDENVRSRCHDILFTNGLCCPTQGWSPFWKCFSKVEGSFKLYGGITIYVQMVQASRPSWRPQVLNKTLTWKNKPLTILHLLRNKILLLNSSKSPTWGQVSLHVGTQWPA